MAANVSTEKRPLNVSIRTIILVLLIAGLSIGGFFFAEAVISTTKRFAFSAPISPMEAIQSALEVSDVNGAIRAVMWNQTYVKVNGTVIANGFGASTSAVSFDESDTNCRFAGLNATCIVFHAVFPTNTGFLLPRYRVNINVYVPSVTGSGAPALFLSQKYTTTNGDVQVSSTGADSISLTTTNGNVQASVATTGELTLATTNGGVDFTCTACGWVVASSTNGGITGTIQPSSGVQSCFAGCNLSTSNGNIALSVPASSPPKGLTASTVNGIITTSGLPIPTQPGLTLNATIEAGHGYIHLKTVNGSITIKGT